MADIIQNKDLEDKKKSAGVMAPQAQQRPIGPSSSGRFVNLQKVIGANRGNQLGSNIAQQTQNIAGQAQGQFGQSQSQFNQQAEQNRLNTQQNRDVRQSALQRLSYGATGPTDVSEQEVSQFAKFREGAYKGPQELQNAAQLQGQAEKLQGIKQNIGSYEGRGGVLNQFFGKPTYSTGQRGLDNLLLAQGMRNIAPQVQQVGRTANLINQGLNAAQLRAQGLTSEAARFGKETGEQIGSTRGASLTALEQKAKEAETAKAEKIKRIQDAIAAGGVEGGNVELTEQEMKDLGVTEGQGLLSDFGNALDISKTAANQQNVATAADYAKMQGLSKLAGNIEQQFTDPTQAESFYKNQIRLDQDKAKAMLNQRIQENLGSQSMEGIRKQYLDTLRDIQLGQANLGGFKLPGQSVPSTDYLKSVADSLNAAYTEGLRHQGLSGDLRSVYGGSNLTDFGAYQKERESPNEALRSKISALRKFVLKPQTPPTE